MAAETMTLTKALVELKLLTKRIDKAIDRLTPVAIRTGHKFDSSIKSQQEFERDTKATWQSIHDLIKRRRKVKTALVLANATKQVTINGETMTIAEAIEKKNYITMEQGIVHKMRHKLSKMEIKVDAHNRETEKTLVRLLESTYAKREAQLSKDDYDRIAKPFKDSNDAKLIDPLDLKKTLDKMEENYNLFLSEVDVCLSVANSTTYIEIT